MRVVRYITSVVAAAVLSLAGTCAFAAPDEIQVYTEELDDPGKFGLELHVNYVLKGATEPSYEGEMKSQHRLQVTPEFSYGLTKSLEAGLYLPAAMSSDGNLYGNGMRFRLKYIAPREDGARLFWGLNTELGYSARRVSESRAGLELRPIIGFRNDKWLVSFNPILDMDLSSNVSREPKFEPALKVTRKAGEGVHVGLEYYGEYGPIHHRIPVAERGHYLYAVADIEFKGFDINFGIGRGFENAGDKWVAKAIIAFPFN
ncbi:MAG: hypothetical protein D4R74_01150 [Betaproteobacteria bacterium]|nr:MAG: hypothetical protein D4R74_01150 [Betaproteobacteria bacterium]